MSEPVSKNIVWSGSKVTTEERSQALGHGGCVVWFTGLSGSGKSTVARRVEQLLLERAVQAYVLDGDNLRFGLNSDLGFAPEDRKENIRRVGEVAALFADAGTIALCAFISPYRADRARVRQRVADERFLEVHLSTPLEVCEERDVKGLYARARAGEIGSFTGISAPYEEPLEPELRLPTQEQSLEESARAVVALLSERGLINP